jgi:putative transcriptional regulator
MSGLAGRLIVATPELTDPNFLRTVVFLIQHDDEGALGVVLTRPSESPVSEHLPELADHATDPPVVFVGGPVEPAVAIGLESVPEPALPTPLGGVGILDVLAPEQAGPCRIFSGYAGWGPGQLEAEITENAWFVVDALPEDIFGHDPEELWSNVLKRQPAPLSWVATYPPEISAN